MVFLSSGGARECSVCLRYMIQSHSLNTIYTTLVINDAKWILYHAGYAFEYRFRHLNTIRLY